MLTILLETSSMPTSAHLADVDAAQPAISHNDGLWHGWHGWHGISFKYQLFDLAK